MVEEGPVADVLERPRMPYTQALVANRGVAASTAAAGGGAPPLLALSGVGASYASRRDVVRDIDLTIARGETMALVGESGSGKSSLARVVTGLLPRQAGQIAFDGAPLPAGLDGRSRDTLRRIQMIYQMPDVALNPRQTVGEIVGRPLTFYLGLKGRALADAVAGLLADIDLGPDFARRYPPELSGGQKQRVCIARALAAQPDLIICDEVTSALDPLVAEGILALLGRLQRQHGYAYLFVSHDLGTVRRIAHRVAVMLEGRIVAQGPVGQVFAPPFHPYTARLLASVPEMRGGWLDEVLGVPGEGGHGRHRFQPA
jgi:peptide/nickel transport system ATP-binding protein